MEGGACRVTFSWRDITLLPDGVDVKVSLPPRGAPHDYLPGRVLVLSERARAREREREREREEGVA